jgi:succinate dehydrogenase / fumarate reductase cytochrome b subunit
MAVDFWSKGARYQRQMLWTIVAVWVIVMVPAAYFMFKHSFEVLFGSK